MSSITENKQDENTTNSPIWKRPDEIMALHRLKMKKKALQDRMKRSNSNKSVLNKIKDNTDNDTFNLTNNKRRNPFSRNNESKRLKENNDVSEVSSDSTLFKLLNLSTNNKTENTSVDNNSPLMNFMNTLNELSSKIEEKKEIQGFNYMPIDWTIKTKMRIISKNPFKWSSKLKTSEEASGITGFVRCLDTTLSESLDTSMSARCHQCCLVWQHPSLPWLKLFPRNKSSRISSNNANFIGTNLETSRILHEDWVEAFRSLFQLVRARQCPYFYICANTFTVLYRAAGICGYNEIHAFVSPTTRGFRQTLKQEDVLFTMPLKKSNNRRSAEGTTIDSGIDTLDASSYDTSSELSAAKNSGSPNVDQQEMEDDEEEEEEEWLESLGVDKIEIRKIHKSQVRMTQTAECSVDNSEESLICVEGVEAQALFNFLINCKSIISTTGALAGVPPTLLSPVAFHGATLKSLKVQESKVRVDNGNYFSVEIIGPILPHTVHSLGSLLHSPDAEYSVIFASLKNTSVFSKIHAGNKNEKDISSVNKETTSCNVFDQENLKDCGLSIPILKHFCSPNPNHVQIVESLKYVGSEMKYTWT